MQTAGDNLYYLIMVAMLGTFLLILLVIILQVRNQNKMLMQQRKLADNEVRHQRELMHAFVSSQESERRRIGMDLHDEVGTALSSLRMILDGEQAATQKKIIDTVIASVRNISHNLSPFLRGAYDLKDAVEEMIERVNGSGKMNGTLYFNGIEDFGFLPEESRMSLYRIVSELVQNTLKHSGAHELMLVFQRDAAALAIRYMDDGIGIANQQLTGIAAGSDPYPSGKPGGIGFFNMETRLAMMQASWKLMPGKGFNMEITIPLNDIIHDKDRRHR